MASISDRWGPISVRPANMSRWRLSDSDSINSPSSVGISLSVCDNESAAAGNIVVELFCDAQIFFKAALRFN